MDLTLQQEKIMALNVPIVSGHPYSFAQMNQWVDTHQPWFWSKNEMVHEN